MKKKPTKKECDLVLKCVQYLESLPKDKKEEEILEMLKDHHERFNKNVKN